MATILWRYLIAGAGMLCAAAGPLTLPPPSGAPQSIDFARDPLLGFGGAGVSAAGFLGGLGSAVAAHPAVAAAVAEAAATRAVRAQVRSGLFPQVDARFVGSRALARDFGDRDAVVESLQPRSRADGIVSGEQLLYDFGATGNRIAAANDRIRGAKAEVERVAADTALKAVAAWYDVLGYQGLVELSTGVVARQAAILVDVRARVAQGVGASGDTARAEAVLADAQAQRAQFDRLLGQARSRYREAFGAEAPPHLDRSRPPASAAASRDVAQMLARASPAVQVAKAQAEAARREVRAAKADGLPRLSAAANGARYDVFTGSDYEVRGSVVLRQSLTAGGRQRGVIAEAAAQSRAAGFVADRVVAESERDAGTAFTDIAALASSTAALEAAYIANRRARDSYVEQFRVARGTLLELLRAERDYFTAAANYLQSVVDLDVARYTLLVRTGEILPAIGVELDAAAM